MRATPITSAPERADDVYLRRGELKPRITYERQLAGFVWVSAQAGLRYNYRFDAFRQPEPRWLEPRSVQ